MIRILIYVIVLGVAMQSCLSPKEQPETSEEAETNESFIHDMPEKDRNLLLDPLEGVLEDLKESIDGDLSLTWDTIPLGLEGVSGNFYVKLYEADYAKIVLEAEAENGNSERHFWYFDRTGSLFYSEHQINSLALEGGWNQTHYKFYFDENGARLSSYGKLAYNGNSMPEEWSSVEVPNEQEAYLTSKYLYIQ